MQSFLAVFRGLVSPPPHIQSGGGGNTSPVKTTAWEAKVNRARGKEKLSNLAGRTVKYGPQNCLITPCVLTERYNKIKISPYSTKAK